jgi:predicted O-methyltransferase YrrM
LHERRHPTLPWLTASVVNILDAWLLPCDVGLEFGSGRSTHWFAQRIGQLISVEHNPSWYDRVKSDLDSSGLEVDYRLHEDGSSELPDSTYVNVARSMPINSLDFCLVDGVTRDHCALAALDKLKTGGVLIIDNVNDL